MDDRKRMLELFSKQLAEGNPLAEEFVNTSRTPMSQAFQARDLAEDSLAHQVLKNTGVPIPSKGASNLKQEDFLNRIIAERYPELSPDVRLTDLKGNAGQYGQGRIDINKKLIDDPIKSVSAGLHEAGHQYDDKILKFDGTDNVDLKQLKTNVPAGRMLQDVDPMQMSEILNKGHHARIPDLRDADSFGLGALKSMLKSGTFKSIVGAAPVIGGLAAAGISGDASAAVPFLGDSENVGESVEDEREMLNDATARNNYNKSQARQDALKKMSGK